LFRPLAINYSKSLDNWFIDHLAECRFTKREFFDVFWAAYAATFTEKNIISVWKKAGVEPRDPSGILDSVREPKHSNRPGMPRQLILPCLYPLFVRFGGS
jgi:hypothetical protein